MEQLGGILGPGPELDLGPEQAPQGGQLARDGRGSVAPLGQRRDVSPQRPDIDSVGLESLGEQCYDDDQRGAGKPLDGPDQDVVQESSGYPVRGGRSG